MKAWKWIAVTAFAAGACGGTTTPDEPNAGALADEAEALGHHHRCGGHHDRGCGVFQYCATSKKSKRCPNLETAGVCRYMPDICEPIEEPMCGCDGETYRNACFASMYGVALAYEGPCAPLCGGMAGIPCPGAGTCIDNPSDTCDPGAGDVDCASICRCETRGLCDDGYHWDDSPAICGCVEG